MQGKILGYSGEKGVIIGDDGARYPFVAAAWMEDDSPLKGAVVDFSVEEDGEATDIYLSLDATPAKSAPRPRPAPTASAPRPRPAPTAPPKLVDTERLKEDIGESLRKVAERDDYIGDTIARVKAVPQIALAAIIVVASLVLGFASIGYEDNGLQDLGYAGLSTSVALISIPEEASPVQDSLRDKREKIDKELDRLDTQKESSLGRSANRLEIQKKLDKLSSAINQMERLLSASYAVWLVPALAIAVLWLGWMQYGAARPVGIVLGVVSIASTLYIYLWEKMTIDLVEAALDNRDTLATVRRAAQKALDLDTGGWIIAAAGIGCIILGLIQRDQPVYEEEY